MELPTGAVSDFLHAYLARALGESGVHLVSYRKYVDDMVLVAVGRWVGPDLIFLASAGVPF